MSHRVTLSLEINNALVGLLVRLRLRVGSQRNASEITLASVAARGASAARSISDEAATAFAQVSTRFTPWFTRRETLCGSISALRYCDLPLPPAHAEQALLEHAIDLTFFATTADAFNTAAAVSAAGVLAPRITRLVAALELAKQHDQWLFEADMLLSENLRARGCCLVDSRAWLY